MMHARWFRVLLAVALAGFATMASAQSWPARAVRIVIPYAAGGGVDGAARLMAAYLTQALGQNFIVDAKPGGATVIGTNAVAHAAPDGYTLLFTGSSTMSILPLVHPTALPFDPLKDFEAVGMVSRMPFFLVASSARPYLRLGDLMADAKARPGQLAYASNGVGSMVHLGISRLTHAAGVDMIHVPYPGFAPALTDLVAGRVAMTMADLAPLKGQIDAGTVKPLAVSSAGRSHFMPDVPTLAEAGYPGTEFEIWLALFAPAGTPQPVIDTLGKAMRAYLGSPEARAAYGKLGHEADASDGPAVRQRIVAEQKAFAPAAVAAGLARKP
ncbi:MAG: hypothetical protein AMXMBFR52_19330 [Burkholderiales bacterium]|nr:hypothetical protein [Rhodocyclaceae bacterium]